MTSGLGSLTSPSLLKVLTTPQPLLPKPGGAALPSPIMPDVHFSLVPPSRRKKEGKGANGKEGRGGERRREEETVFPGD